MNSSNDEISHSDKLDLCQAALAARENAYAVYSKFAVGAAVIDRNDRVFVGCNVENASFGLTVCAERNAVFNAVVNGSRDFKAMAIATSGGHLPCGACRQVLVEFQDDLTLLICDADRPDSIREVSLKDIFPGKFVLR